MRQAVLGHFTYADVLLDAAKRLKDSGYDVTVFSPIPLGHEIEYTLGGRKNHIRYFAFFGAVIGFCLGVLLTLGTAAMYVLPRGGKPIFSITPTLLVSYETAILFGVLISFIGFCIFARLPYYGKKIYDDKVGVDSFGLLVDNIRDNKIGDVENILKEYGADEVKRVEEK